MSEAADAKPNASNTPSSSVSPQTDKAPGPSKPPPASGNGAPKGNPAFRAMGLPNFRLRLPSRNWMIFLTIVGSWTGTLVYDRRQKRKIQEKWCTLVEHIAKEPLPTTSMTRKMTIILSAAPGDGLRGSREHFTEYVKPVLVAAAIDWDVIEGRKEGEVRAGLAEKVRRYRRRKGGEADPQGLEQEPLDKETIIENSRHMRGIDEYEGTAGDIVIGRNTWKEYMRGLHEGWLGPLEAPKPEVSTDTTTISQLDTSPSSKPSPSDSTADLLTDTASTTDSAQTSDDASPTSDPTSSSTTEKPKEEESKTPPKPSVTPPYNTPASYNTSPLAPSIPTELSPNTPIPFPHVLGFLRTPVRMYRFLTRRYLADDVGRRVAAAVLASHRPFHEGDSLDGNVTSDTTLSSNTDFSTNNPDDSTTSPYQSQSKITWEQEGILQHEEVEWPKAFRQRKPDEQNPNKEREWTDEMVIDPRIGRRMRQFELEPGDEERANAIWKGAKGIPGRREGDSGGLEGGDE